MTDLITPSPQPEPVALEQRLIEIAKVLPKPKTLGWIPGDVYELDEAIKGYTKQQVLAILAKHWVAAPPPPAQPEPLTLRDQHKAWSTWYLSQHGRDVGGCSADFSWMTWTAAQAAAVERSIRESKT